MAGHSHFVPAQAMLKIFTKIQKVRVMGLFSYRLMLSHESSGLLRTWLTSDEAL